MLFLPLVLVVVLAVLRFAPFTAIFLGALVPSLDAGRGDVEVPALRRAARAASAAAHRD